jgi:hypothetical protein
MLRYQSQVLEQRHEEMYNMNHKRLFVILPIIAVLLGAIPTFVYAQNGQNGIPPIAPNDCSLNASLVDSCFNAGHLAGFVTYPHPFYGCTVSSQMNRTQGDSYCYGFRTGQLQLVLTRNNSTQPQSFNGQDFGDFSNLANIPLVGGMIASKSFQSGVLHNEQGVFISWSTICNHGQTVLLQSCGTLVDSNGNLTPQGDTAVGCIRNGLAATIVADKFGISHDLVKGGLGFLASMTGCSGIVNMDTIQSAPEFQQVLTYIESLVPAP